MEFEPSISRFRVLVTLQRQLRPQALGSTVKHACLAGTMQFLDPPENHIPVRAAEMRRGDQICDGVAVVVVELDVEGVFVGDLGC